MGKGKEVVKLEIMEHLFFYPAHEDSPGLTEGLIQTYKHIKTQLIILQMTQGPG